jgi:hypothetical protein
VFKAQSLREVDFKESITPKKTIGSCMRGACSYDKDEGYSKSKAANE